MNKALMICRTTLLILLLVFAKTGRAQPSAPEGKIWKEVPALTDEFNSWNSSKWTKSLWNYGEPVQMVARNSGVVKGNLIIKATLDNSSTRWFETSRVMSRAKISYPMYTECSMKTAQISAYNTFWLNNGNSANRDEIDVCENNSKASIISQREERQYKMYSQYFVVVDNDTERNKGNFDNRNLSADNPLKGVKWNEAYHTLGVWWKDANNIQFYLDGEPAGKVKSTRDFTRDLNIIWDLWTIDATWSGGIADKNDLLNDEINTMYVDWIHTYTLEEDPSASISQKALTEMIQIYPNPVGDTMSIKFNGKISENASLEIYDCHGQMVKTEPVMSDDHLVSINDLSTGVYVVKLTNSEYSQTFIKQ